MAKQSNDLIIAPTSALPVGATYPFVFPATADASSWWNDAKAYLVLTVTDVTSSPTIKPHLLTYDRASNTFFEFWVAASAESPGGSPPYTYAYILLDNGFTPSAGGVIKEVSQVYLAPYMRLDLEIGGTGSLTVTAGFNRVNSIYSGV